jgi:dTDP-4-amino-4,6-dideoxygalactose transaminase
LYKEKAVGTFGIFSAFSFYPTKNLGAYGDGGAIATNNKALAEKLKKLRNYGQKHRYEHLYKGLNSRLDELQAGILRVKLRHLQKSNTRRRAIAARYSKGLQNLPGIILPAERENAEHIYHLYVIRTTKRKAFMSFLKRNKIVSLIHYPTPIHKQPCYPEFHSIHLPKTEQAASQVLSLPIHPYLSNADVDRVIASIRTFANKNLTK